MITSLNLNHAVANSAYNFSKIDIFYPNLLNYLMKLKITNIQIYLYFLIDVTIAQNKKEALKLLLNGGGGEI